MHTTNKERNMNTNYTMYIYKLDRRTRTGERLFSTTVWCNRDDNGMRREVAALFDLYNPDRGWRIEWFPTMKTVKSLMTGKEVEIPHDTPRACDPSSELYWSM
jgi:hypothetical protein